ncbi:MAG: hypothetical protein ACOYJJ_02110 [Anaerovoracaceae bacterium]
MNRVITDGYANARLRELGEAKINSFSARFNRIFYRLNEEITVTYLYLMEDEKVIALYRLDPYPINLGVPRNEDELIRFVKSDYSRFQNAYEQGRLAEYLKICSGIGKINDIVDTMFHEKPSEEFLDAVESSIQKTLDTLNGYKEAEVGLEYFERRRQPED